MMKQSTWYSRIGTTILAACILALAGCQNEGTITDPASQETLGDLEKRGASSTFGCETAFAYPINNVAALSNIVKSNRWGWSANISMLEDNYLHYPNGVEPWQLWAAVGQNDFSKGYYVGDITVTIDRESDGKLFKVNVCFDNLFAGYVISELHIYVGDTPTTAAPGQFTLKKEFNPKTNNPGCFSFRNVKAQDGCDNVWIIIHAVVCKK